MHALLKWLMDDDAASAILGDLTEQRRSRAGSRHQATIWFWRTAAGIAFFIGIRRAGDTLRTWAGGGFGLTGLSNDMRQACRGLFRTRWYAATAIGVIALAMSLGTTAFAVVDGVLFKPLPYRAPGELYQVAGAFSKLPPAPGKTSRVITLASLVDVNAWSAVSAPATLAAFDVSGPPFTLTADLRPRVAEVDDRVLDVLGVTPLAGGFRPEHFVGPSAVRPVLISYTLWQGHFGGATPIIGHVAGPPDDRVEIVGVLPRGFVFPAPARRLVPDLLTPLFVEGASRTNVRSRSLMVIGRIPASVAPAGPAGIEARLTSAARDIAAAWPTVSLPATANENMRITRGPADLVAARPLRDVLTSADVAVSRVVFAATAFLILLSALTVAGLSASRLEDRRSELAVRRALGGTSTRIVRLLAAESAVMVIAGAAAGWLLASPLLKVTLTLMPLGLMHLKPPTLDGRVLVFGALASALTVAIVTLWAARSIPSHRLGAAMASARTTPGRASVRGRSVLVAMQVAAAVVMAVCGALLAASLARIWGEDPGFNPDRAATIRVDQTAGTTLPTILQLVATLEGFPGVTAAGGLGGPFLDNMFNGNGFERPASASDEFPAEGISVTRGFFAAAGLHAVQGRLPTDRELDTGEPVLAVSEHVARTYWPGASAIGQRLRKDGTDREFEVVGVVRDARYRSLDRDPDGAIYSSLAAERNPSLMNVMLRFDDDAISTLPDIAEAISARFPMYRVRSARTVTASLGESIRVRRFQTWLFSAFGLAAIVLTGAGILGVMAMTTARRTREVGIRMAIGATRADVIAHLLREQLLTVAAGLLAGGMIAAWASQFVRAYVYKIDLYDPVVWLATVVTILATATVGTLLPALQASKVDPVKALRVD